MGMQEKAFDRSNEDEPHAARRKLILSKHPKIKELYGPDIRLLYWTVTMVAMQYAMMMCVKDKPWWILLCVAYSFGGTVNHSLFLAGHELSHDLCFKKSSYNRWLAIFSNLCQAVPSASTFKRYHLEHHMHQGVDGIDVDVPVAFEGYFFRNSLTKTVWVLLQPLWYSLRPAIVNPKSKNGWEIINWSLIIGLNIALVWFLGIGSLSYFMASSLLGMGLHPCAGHFIAEHYVFTKGQETYSYYGPLNWITFNVGYHNEHHDFPHISGFRLPQVKAIAPEFYDNLPCHTSWTKVIVDFILDSEVGPFNRVTRPVETNKLLSGRKVATNGDAFSATSIAYAGACAALMLAMASGAALSAVY